MENRPSCRVMEIDFFRFVFSVIILYLHAEQYLLKTNLLFPGSAFSVGFFFLVSGYLMMASLEKDRGKEIKNLGLETVSFLKRKAVAIYPEFVLAFLIGFVFRCIARELPWPPLASAYYTRAETAKRQALIQGLPQSICLLF